MAMKNLRKTSQNGNFKKQNVAIDMPLKPLCLVDQCIATMRTSRQIFQI